MMDVLVVVQDIFGLRSGGGSHGGSAEHQKGSHSECN